MRKWNFETKFWRYFLESIYHQTNPKSSSVMSDMVGTYSVYYIGQVKQVPMMFIIFYYPIIPLPFNNRKATVAGIWENIFYREQHSKRQKLTLELVEPTGT